MSSLIRIIPTGDGGVEQIQTITQKTIHWECVKLSPCLTKNARVSFCSIWGGLYTRLWNIRGRSFWMKILGTSLPWWISKARSSRLSYKIMAIMATMALKIHCNLSQARQTGPPFYGCRTRAPLPGPTTQPTLYMNRLHQYRDCRCGNVLIGTGKK